MSRKKLLGCALGAGLLAASAVSFAQAPPPPPPPPSDVTVSVTTQEPPPIKKEVVLESARPDPGYIWVAGYWDWRSTGWEWVSGHWEKPPAPADSGTTEVTWVAPEYIRSDRGVRYVPGHWTTQRVYEYDANGRKVEVRVKEKTRIK